MELFIFFAVVTGSRQQGAMLSVDKAEQAVRNEKWTAPLERYMDERDAPKARQKGMISQQSIGGSASMSPPVVEVQMDLRLQGHIGNKLRAVYEEIVDEPIPDRFLKLLAELKRKEDGCP